jgi:hypothetical protein
VLHEFLTSNHEELIARCRVKVNHRQAARGTAVRRVGNIGLMGATGTLLEDSLLRLRDLIDQSLPEIRLSTGMTAPPKP